MRRTRLKITGPRSERSYEAVISNCWDHLKELQQLRFIPGAPRELKPRGHALTIRKGKKVESWYVPRTLVKEVREKAKRYRLARELLAKMAYAELELLKLRATKAKVSGKREGHADAW